MNPRLLILFAASLIIGCAPSEFVVRKDYGKNEFKDMGLAVVAITPGQIDTNSLFGFNYHFKPEPAQAKAALADTFNRYFSSYIMDSSYLVLPDTLPAFSCDTGCRVFSQIIDSGKKEERILQFRIPDSTALFGAAPPKRYALFTQNLIIADTLKDSKSYSSNPPFSAIASTSGQLELSTEYILWDYWKGDCVTSGILKDRVSAVYAIERNDWRTLINYAADRLLRRASLIRPAK